MGLGCVLVATCALNIACALGRLVHFEISVSQEVRSPDGHARPQLLVNGTSPGPLLALDQGDDVEVSSLYRLTGRCTLYAEMLTQR